MSASASWSAAIPKSVRTTHAACGALDQDVARLDVAVQHSLGMHLAQRPDQFESDPGRLAHVQRPVLDHDPFEGAARDELHDDPQPLARVHHVVDADDMGMVDPRRRPRLAQRAFPARAGVLGIESVYAHFLDRDLPVEHFVGGSPHPPHSP